MKSINPFDGYLNEKQIVSSVVVNAKSPNVITSNPISISNPLPHNCDDSVTFKVICYFWANKKSIVYILDFDVIPVVPTVAVLIGCKLYF